MEFRADTGSQIERLRDGSIMANYRWTWEKRPFILPKLHADVAQLTSVIAGDVEIKPTVLANERLDSTLNTD